MVTNFPNNSELAGTFIFHKYSELLPRMQNNENLFEKISPGEQHIQQLWKLERVNKVLQLEMSFCKSQPNV